MAGAVKQANATEEQRDDKLTTEVDTMSVNMANLKAENSRCQEQAFHSAMAAAAGRQDDDVSALTSVISGLQAENSNLRLQISGNTMPTTGTGSNNTEQQKREAELLRNAKSRAPDACRGMNGGKHWQCKWCCVKCGQNSAMGNCEESTATDKFDLPLPSEATEHHVLPQGDIQRPVLSVGKACDAGLDVWFNKLACQFCKDGVKTLKAPRDPWLSPWVLPSRVATTNNLPDKTRFHQSAFTNDTCVLTAAMTSDTIWTQMRPQAWDCRDSKHGSRLTTHTKSTVSHGSSIISTHVPGSPKRTHGFRPLTAAATWGGWGQQLQG